MTIAQWKHKGGSVVTLIDLQGGAYGIEATGSGGVFYALDHACAVAETERRLTLGYFSRDNWTTGYEIQDGPYARPYGDWCARPGMCTQSGRCENYPTCGD